MKTKIAIYVSGGVVQEVRTNSKIPIDINVFDVDNLMDDKSSELIEDDWNKILKQCPKELAL
jgi:hypothetical protein